MSTRVGRFPVAAKGGTAVADHDSLYVATGDVCLRLNAATGETVQTYRPPPLPEPAASESSEPLVWGYLAQEDDLIFGSMGSAIGKAQYIFALGKDDGEPRWVYTPAAAVNPPEAITIGGGIVYLLDTTSAAELERRKRRGESAVGKSELLALDAATGEILWRTQEGAVKRGSDLRLAQDVVLDTGGGMTAFSAHDGEMLWDRDVSMLRFPVIVRGTIYAEPYAYDLRTGGPKQRVHPLTREQVPWNFERSYGCGSIAGAPNMLLFRSGTLAFYDLAGDSGIHHFGGVKAGCFVNAIAANGLVLVPPGGAGCSCGYKYQTTVALAPTTRNEEWSVFSAEGFKPETKIRQLAVNFGAPGDRRDGEGKLWLGFPRPEGFWVVPTPAGLDVPLQTKLSLRGDYFRCNADQVLIGATNCPWLYASGCRGLRSARLNLFRETPSEVPQTEAKSYTVRLHFAELDNLKPGQRAFDVKLQGEVVLEGLDIVKEAGGRNVALVKEFRDIQGEETIKLEFVPHTERAPIISAIEIYEE